MLCRMEIFVILDLMFKVEGEMKLPANKMFTFFAGYFVKKFTGILTNKCLC